MLPTLVTASSSSKVGPKSLTRVGSAQLQSIRAKRSASSRSLSASATEDALLNGREGGGRSKTDSDKLKAIYHLGIGLLMGYSFVILCVALVVYASTNFREELKDEINGKINKIDDYMDTSVREGLNEVIEERLASINKRFLLMPAFAMLDMNNHRNGAWNVETASFPDSSADYLIGPIGTDPRITCKPGANRQREGCINGVNKSISLHHGSVFVTGVDDQRSNVERLMREFDSDIKRSGIVDPLIASVLDRERTHGGPVVAWSCVMDHWQRAIAVQRTVPGLVGDLASREGYRSFDPFAAPWYRIHVENGGVDGNNLERTFEGRLNYKILLSEPYWKSDINNFVVAVSLSRVNLTNPTTSVVMGCFMTPDVFAPNHSNPSGRTAHVYHIATGILAWSPNWSPTTPGQTLHYTNLSIGEDGGGPLLPEGPCEGCTTVDGLRICRGPLASKSYCVVSVRVMLLDHPVLSDIHSFHQIFG